jgi:hypothetical protein
MTDRSDLPASALPLLGLDRPVEVINVSWRPGQFHLLVKTADAEEWLALALDPRRARLLRDGLTSMLRKERQHPAGEHRERSRGGDRTSDDDPPSILG